ncbi:helix-turn-helix domain-containing protein [Clostridium botulinum]|uniref:helix-turn-helix domain-containing protein n=1 Tax=Clostridium botulinum TaxID=1491 RepID=UPI001966D3C8|nr:helix-turn-helix transcriptional regulator [Clostridium botulinum]MBN1077739.1 XRE family transcriptional regulator [Clostridium botulinum]HBJ1648630.1 helix-turn-helix transcriptional regulator [Clostridium botulinum]
MLLKDRLKELRIEKNLLQKDLANFLNITTSAYGYYEQGKRIPDSDTVKKIADFFNVSLDYLIGNSDIKESAEILINNNLSTKANNSPIDDKLIEKLKNLDDESKKELEKYMDLLKLKESMDESKNEVPSSLKQA